ncbi:MAG: hypothetical protein J6K42_04805 [Clostridia bacterium]|nr:hypothetical protein [Clostridia bacterium]
MKFIKKVNIGLILAIIAIVAVIVYSVNLEFERKSAKEDIRKACEEFIDLTDKYYTLPSEYQVIGEKSADVDLTNFFTKMEDELKTKTTSAETAKIQKTILTEYVKNQLVDTSKITVSFNREITKISSYGFDGNQVTITFSSKITTKQKYNDINLETGEPSEKIRENTFEVEDESITLEEKDGTWKIVYANLQYQDVNSSMYYGIM